MSSEQSKEPRKILMAKRLVVSQIKGPNVVYSHVTMFHAEDGIIQVTGESLDSWGMPKIVYDKYLVKDINITWVEWFVPKE